MMKKQALNKYTQRDDKQLPFVRKQMVRNQALNKFYGENYALINKQHPDADHRVVTFIICNMWMKQLKQYEMFEKQACQTRGRFTIVDSEEFY